MIKALVFDMGGVLLQTRDRGPRTALAARYGMSYEEIDGLVFDSPTAIRASLGEITEEAHWDSIGRQLGLSPVELDAFQDGFWGGDRLNGVLMDYIRASRPSYRTGLLSNAWSNARWTFGNRYHAADAFDKIIFSAEVKLAKPDARIYELLLSELGVEPDEAIFVDDVLKNIEAARALGMCGVVYRRDEQALREIRELLDNH